ncbi:hypothetical protein PTE30175_02310 [Pandoraea terrae]|uniref:Uncharacterized protein n=1 Tax=Pandoraea terrae TaxID=1537710 RepID=A0A5E4V2U0_9BURK|nr:hypothetical protein PTE30175_02310 [Pandoraea terrae]
MRAAVMMAFVTMMVAARHLGDFSALQLRCCIVRRMTH